jgi:hypothetical protein
VLLAAFIVKSLPLTALRTLVTVVVLYAAITMLRAAMREKGADAARPAAPLPSGAAAGDAT